MKPDAVLREHGLERLQLLKVLAEFGSGSPMPKVYEPEFSDAGVVL